MKGKGKKEKELSGEVDECPLQFLDFRPIDHMRQCPRFTSVVQRNEDESIGSEDLDVLQLELETLLVSVVKRQRLLETEMEALINWYDSRDTKSRDKRSPNKQQSEITGKRSKHTDEKPNKKFKDSPSSASGKMHNSRPHKIKNTPIKFSETDYSEPEQKAVSKKVPVKNDIPNQFWNYIEPYCCEITSEHIKVITEHLKSYENDAEYYKIPNLGKHYSLKWEHNDCSDQKEHSGADKKKGLSASNSTGSSVAQSSTKSKKGSKNYSDPDKASFGALTQRLVSCLIEENLLNGGLIDPKSMDNETNSSKGNNGSPNNKIFKSLNLGNTAQLERRIRKELEEHGIMSMDDILNVPETTSSDEDEILQELKRCQQELKSLTTKNQTHLKRLLSLAKKEMTRQEVSKKLQNADTEVIEAYRRITSAKQKKRSPTKKERELATKALKERENLLKQLESLS